MDGMKDGMSLLRTALAAGAGALALTSCGPTIHSDRDESIPVPRGASWAWARRDTAAGAARAPSEVGEIVQQRFRRAIEATMLAKGYREVPAESGADFALALQFGAPPDGHVARRTGAVAVGVSAGWGYRPWGFGRIGFSRPWGLLDPWALYQPWGVYGTPVWGGYAVPVYGGRRRVYSDRALVVVLRDRPTGEVAWSARLGSDALGSHQLTQDRVRELTDKLFKSLR